MSRLSIAYPMRKSRDTFVSRKAYESDFLKFLSDFADILKLPIEYIEAGYEFEPSPSYLFVNIDTWGLKLFILRAQGKIDLPFFIYFHVIYGQDIYISYLLPLLRENDVVVVNSEYARSCFSRISPVIPVHVVPLGLDIPKITALAAQEKVTLSQERKKSIAYLGQIIPEKGIGELIECIPEIIAQTTDEIYLKVIGPLSGSDIKGGTSAYVRQLQERATRLGIASNIEWSGVLFGDEKYRALSRCDIFINPGTFKIETFGVVNTEALACGLPVICSNWSAFPEVVREGENGYLVNVREPQDTGDSYAYCIDHPGLIGQVVHLLNDGEWLAQMKKEAQESAQAYDYHLLMPPLIGLLEQSLARKAGDGNASTSSAKGKTDQGKEPIDRDWENIKERNFLGFPGLFEDEWLEVIQEERIVYGSYAEVYRRHGPGIDFPPGMRHKIFQYLSGRS